MDNYLITGIQQVGVGTVDMMKSWKWYAEMFQTDVRILEDDTVAELMLPYTGNSPQRRHACITVNLQGGGGLEVWQYSQRRPQPPAFEVRPGDLGIFAAKMKSRDVKAFHDELASKYADVGPVGTAPDGSPVFYVVDPYKNIFQVVEDPYVFIDGHRLSGGIVGAMIGTTDVERALTVYRDLLGYDKLVYDKSGQFDDFRYLNGGGQHYRRVLLGRSKPHEGPFSGLYGNGTIELVQALDRTPRKIYEGRFWGDPGFIQICFDIVNMRGLEKACIEKGYPFTVDSCAGRPEFDMGKAAGHFTYIEDPDGTLIEFVETHKVPLVAKLNIAVNLMKRDRTKRLPKALFRLMKFNRVKFD